MLALRAALGLLLVGVLRAFPQDGHLQASCARASNRYYDKASRACCYRCPPGQSPVKTRPCPQGPADCRKRCDHDYYLSASNRCMACVSCLGADLVEKAPCSRDTPRVCECRPGMFCATSASNSCARCSPHSVCPAGLVVKSPGTAEKDTVCGPPSPGAGPDCANPEDCKTLSSDTTPQAEPILMSPTAEARTTLQRGVTSRTLEDASPLTRARRPPSSAGPSPPWPCPQGSADCRKQCDPDYYLDGTGRCTACVSCVRDDLVEKAPCSRNSPRVCECRPGMFCATSATNSCARCVARPACAPGTVVQPQGVAEGEPTHEPPPPGTHANCSTPGSREAPASTAAALSPLVDSRTSRTLPASTVSLPPTGKPILDPGPVLFWMIMVPVLVVGSSFFLLCHQRACRRRFRQKLQLCYPAQTFAPKLELVDSRPRRNLTPRRSELVTEPGTEERSFVSPPAVETCDSVGTACPSSLPLLGSSPAGVPSSPRDAEPPVSTEHTNNKIEKIYIMKADTVIVGTVRTEASEGRGPVGPVGPEEAELEVDHVPHYPEQETEPPLGSCGDVMFSVEEEGKEDFGPTVASGK
ncbi:tumor necrosis factor receptor superfamily member 8 isoform X1 [Sciurus carolinensis]|uniref:tumor necrosis factor receptor superfamily member 8 isoform X1 n=1 Tax=Sciurus carolinensis TaxID=30640 RepID=UPI001FB4F881|nr:tumor necrosis factor receptor superfamily member 8 isoform X1 [Sciurus carolinensis]